DDPAYDLGQGAGFYIDATEAPWAAHFKMESYITEDLIAAVEGAFPLLSRRSIFGHSMGGHGALTLAMKHANRFISVSAFAPICSPTRCPWGEKAFTAYLGESRGAWRAHDAALLMGDGRAQGLGEILVDQGTGDQFLESQLKPETLEAAARLSNTKLKLRRQEGYDHSYFFMASFMEEHVAFHAARLA
ncbi:MAG TPA: alpha/beta hydrolase-fold protein, partial [Terricaulis sp.]|nr:alpha/beta hydrolase-fold protein [Terricaulis sp.]